MKFRKGFVTNSSSISFVCEFSGCDRRYDGYDGCDSYIPDDWCHCERGHWFCEEHMEETYRKSINKLSLGYDKQWLPEEFCPICQSEKGLYSPNQSTETITVTISKEEYEQFLKWKEMTQNENQK